MKSSLLRLACALTVTLAGSSTIIDARAASAAPTASSTTLTAVADRAASADPLARPAQGRRDKGSGKPWLSGVFAHSSELAREFQAMRGSSVDVVSVHPQRESFSAMMDPWWLDQTAAVRRSGARLEVSVPTWPLDSGPDQAAGKQWRAFGKLLVKRNAADAIIVIGKEFNLPNGWHITQANQQQWRERFRQAATALRSVRGNRFKIAWTPNEGPSQTGVVSTAAWPGAAYVDIVAPDYYDQWDPIRTRAQAKARFNRTYGIEWWFKWATKRGVDVGVSEWGVSSGSQWAGHAGGDNPFYIEAMHRLFVRYREHLVYESYFEEPASYVASSLVSQNPQARARYRTLW